jgi:hypothetical protein
VGDCVHESKQKYDNPWVVVAGDFNQFRPEETLADHPDVKQVKLRPTRGRRCIDRVFTNLGWLLSSSGVITPLQSAEGSNSDHKVVYTSAALPGREKGEWISYKVRQYCGSGAKKFREWLATVDWSDL